MFMEYKGQGQLALPTSVKLQPFCFILRANSLFLPFFGSSLPRHTESACENRHKHLFFSHTRSTPLTSPSPTRTTHGLPTARSSSPGAHSTLVPHLRTKLCEEQRERYLLWRHGSHPSSRRAARWSGHRNCTSSPPHPGLWISPPSWNSTQVFSLLLAKNN